MAHSNVRLDVVLELLVMIFQVAGVAAMCLTRFVPGSRWADRGKIGVIVAMVALGVIGAICGRQHSEFALFAGLTITALFIGMTIGGGAREATYSTGISGIPEA